MRILAAHMDIAIAFHPSKSCLASLGIEARNARQKNGPSPGQLPVPVSMTAMSTIVIGIPYLW